MNSFKQSQAVIYTGFYLENEVCDILTFWFIYLIILIVLLSPRSPPPFFFAIAFILKWQFFTLSIILLFRQGFFSASIKELVLMFPPNHFYAVIHAIKCGSRH